MVGGQDSLTQCNAYISKTTEPFKLPLRGVTLQDHLRFAVDHERVVVVQHGGSELEDRVNPLSTGFSTTLSDLNNGGPFNYNYDPNSPNNNNGTTNSNSSDPVVYFGLVERRPDFEYNDGHREFAPTETYTTGQKGLGVGPGLRSKRTQYSPLGEF